MFRIYAAHGWNYEMLDLMERLRLKPDKPLYEGLADFAAEHLRSCRVSEKLIQSGAIDLDAYAEDLLETSGYMEASDEIGYVRRNTREFIREYTLKEPCAKQKARMAMQ